MGPKSIKGRYARRLGEKRNQTVMTVLVTAITLCRKSLLDEQYDVI